MAQYQALNETLKPLRMFVCEDCGEALHLPPANHSGGSGYGCKDDGAMVCYACCAKADMKRMRADGKATLYLASINGIATNWPMRHHGEVTNWPGTLRLSCIVQRGRHNIARTRYDVWFRFEGKPWHGVCYGENTQIVHCKRIKD